MWHLLRFNQTLLLISEILVLISFMVFLDVGTLIVAFVIQNINTANKFMTMLH